MRYNPIQTNQRPRREKVAQRIWEMVRLFAWGLSPWFARRWRVAWLRFSSLWYEYGGGGASLGMPLSRGRLVLIIHGIFPSGLGRPLDYIRGCIVSTK